MANRLVSPATITKEPTRSKLFHASINSHCLLLIGKEIKRSDDNKPVIKATLGTTSQTELSSSQNDFVLSIY